MTPGNSSKCGSTGVHGRPTKAPRWPATCLLLSTLLACGGCPDGRRTFLEVHAVDVPATLHPLDCGSQALAAAMAHCDGTQRAADIHSRLPNKGQVTNAILMLVIARQFGYHAEVKRGTLALLRQALQENIAPLVMYDVDLVVPEGARRATSPHWSVVRGIAEDDSAIRFALPSDGHADMPWQEFERRWKTTACCTILITAAPETSRNSDGERQTATPEP